MADRSVATVAALVARHDAARTALRDRVLAQVLRVLGLAGEAWYDDEQVRAAAGRAMTLVRTGQRQEADLAARAITSHVRALDPRAARRPGTVVIPDDPRGLDGTGVQYERPAATYRRLRADGLDELAAEDAALERARLIVDDDLSLGHRHGARATLLTLPAVTGYRRVIRPELSRGGVCGLCIVAADRVYSRDDLMPVHTRCNCQVMPIVGDRDPGRTLNGDDLARLYETAGGTTAQALKDVRVVVREHGELGPVLRRSGDAFRGPDDVADDTVRAA